MLNINRIDLNLFIVFNAIYTERGITRAGDSLKLSQPAISHSLARLRELIGDPLFIREGNSVTSTPVADHLIGPVRKALREIERSLLQLSEFTPELSPLEFRIGMSLVLESLTMPLLVDTIKDIAPHVRISTARHSRSLFQEQLATKHLDAVVDVWLPHGHTVSHKFLGPGKMVVVARQGHPVVNGSISMEDYLKQDHITATSRRIGRAMEDEELARLGFQRRVKMRCQHHWTACKIVSATDMLLTMPRRNARATNETLGNQLVPFPIEMPAPDVYLYWRANAEDEPANRWLREQIHTAFQLS